jgi:hypothetical protein
VYVAAYCNRMYTLLCNQLEDIQHGDFITTVSFVLIRHEIRLHIMAIHIVLTQLVGAPDVSPSHEQNGEARDRILHCKI